MIRKVLQISKWHLLTPRSSAVFHSFPPNSISSPSKETALVQFQKRTEALRSVFPEVIDSFINRCNLNDRTDVSSWVKEVFDYNMKGGKLLRGLSTVMAYEAFEKTENVTPESLRMSYVMGCCVEMAYGILIDDVMDGSFMRRGAPCWYTLPHVGLRAVNDSVLVYTAVHNTLRSYFGHLPSYFNMIDRVTEVTAICSAGQFLDYTVSREHKTDYSKFTIETYNAIAKYKTSYNFLLGIYLGMTLAKNNEGVMNKKFEEICFKIGGLYQMQDDFIDVFGSETVSGKVGTDIQEGKCNWLAVTALERCNEGQRREFVSCYGSADPADVTRIKALYQDLNLPDIYRAEEIKRYNEVMFLVNHLDESEKVIALFRNQLYFIINRNK